VAAASRPDSVSGWLQTAARPGSAEVAAPISARSGGRGRRGPP